MSSKNSNLIDRIYFRTIRHSINQGQRNCNGNTLGGIEQKEEQEQDRHRRSIIFWWWLCVNKANIRWNHWFINGLRALLDVVLCLLTVEVLSKHCWLCLTSLLTVEHDRSQSKNDRPPVLILETKFGLLSSGHTDWPFFQKKFKLGERQPKCYENLPKHLAVVLNTKSGNIWLRW